MRTATLAVVLATLVPNLCGTEKTAQLSKSATWQEAAAAAAEDLLSKNKVGSDDKSLIAFLRRQIPESAESAQALVAKLAGDNEIERERASRALIVLGS